MLRFHLRSFKRSDAPKVAGVDATEAAAHPSAEHAHVAGAHSPGTDYPDWRESVRHHPHPSDHEQ